MAEFRYAQFCPLARAAEVVGNRWSLLVLRELMLGPQRFSDLRRRLAGVSTSVLASRLAALEGFGVIASDELPPPAASRVYRLTPQGEAFRPVLLELARWGLGWLRAPARGDHFEPDWLRLSLAAFAVPGPLPARCFELRFAGSRPPQRLRFAGGEAGLRFVDPAAGPPPDVAVEARPEDLLGLLAGRLPVEVARARGARIEGDAAVLAELPALFRFDSTERAHSQPQGVST